MPDPGQSHELLSEKRDAEVARQSKFKENGWLYSRKRHTIILDESGKSRGKLVGMRMKEAKQVDILPLRLQHELRSTAGERTLKVVP